MKVNDYDADDWVGTESIKIRAFAIYMVVIDGKRMCPRLVFFSENFQVKYPTLFEYHTENLGFLVQSSGKRPGFVLGSVKIWNESVSKTGLECVYCSG